jgi:hypothetical protein
VPALTLLATALGTAACGPNPLPPPLVLLVTGQEEEARDTLLGAQRLDVERRAADGSSGPYATYEPPVESFPAERSGYAAYAVTAESASGERQLAGRSLILDQTALAAVEVPLFVGRVEEFSRPPGAFMEPASAGAPAALLGERSLVLVGSRTESGAAWVERYDVGAFATVPRRVALSCPNPPCGFRSLVGIGTSLLLALTEKDAVWLDLEDESSGRAPLPAGLTSYAEVAGGSTIRSDDGTSYLVGATRLEEPSQTVLRISTTGVVTALPLAVPRQGAAACWAKGRGLAVVGGSSSGPAVEWLPSGTDAFLPSGYAPDESEGAGVVVLSGDELLRVGGSVGGEPAPSVRYMLSCLADCTPEAAEPSVPLMAATAFAFEPDAMPGAPPGDVLVVGTDGAGSTAAYRLREGAAQLVPLREPRRGAMALAIPAIGQLAVLGGVAADGQPVHSIELYIP